MTTVELSELRTFDILPVRVSARPGRHSRSHLSFNVVSDNSAKMNATIQNRTTTCVSFQPVSSK